MDPYGSQPPQRREQPPPSGTPIFDRLVAEWRAAGRDPVPQAPQQPTAHRGGFVPAARTSDEVAEN
ncbi:hypothetical protein CIB93_10035 [Streptomyces sp. WZ.A104]|uniref:hypothetical protein n=1 Tax=Streptomyces sp. WZ.A104 TaxID=2023771 RepID=UPI000BBB9507|nr:hypothetical protein [Streptomyces sp. WZ.A104]PCG86291.1 hypothetical protein CIB93_10035 [Streptomyces sp. WZ.A104]